MAGAKFTPGPWAVSNKEYGTWSTDVRAGADASGRRVASTFSVNAPKKGKGESRECYKERYDTQARTNEANARLIAAAPDLLAALDRLLAHYVGLVASGDAGFWDAEAEDEVVAARAALAKAGAA